MHTDRKPNTDNNNKHAVQTFNVQQDIFQQTNSQRQKHKLVGVGNNNNKKNQKTQTHCIPILLKHLTIALST